MNCPNIYTDLWQYAIANGGCQQCYSSGFPPVDLDISTSGQDQLNYMLEIV